MKKSKIIRIILSVVFIGIFAFSLYKITTQLLEENDSKALYEDIINDAVVELPAVQSIPQNTDEPKPPAVPITVDFEKLKLKYPDIIGWLYSPNTKINYPVVLGKDNQQYLYNMPSGEPNKSGSIFADSRNLPFDEAKNYIIYGHNMKNKTMFGTLDDYRKTGYYEKHPVMYYLTPEKAYKLEIYSGFITEAGSYVYTFEHTEKSLADFMNKIKRKSTFKSEVKYQEGDRILTLSTCSYETEDSRYVVVGILKEIIEEK